MEPGPAPTTPPTRQPTPPPDSAEKRRRLNHDDCVSDAGVTAPDTKLGLAPEAAGGPPSWDDLCRELGQNILKSGKWQRNRKGGNIGITGAHVDIDVSKYTPLLTVRQVFQKNALNELLWYLRGEDHARWLRKQGHMFWDADADEDGWVGYNYGLLVNWPCRDGGHLNPLEQILTEIQAGGSSRTWYISLHKLDEKT